MPTVYVNDKPVEIGSQKLNCVQVAELAGTLVPHYCYHPGLSVVASCRMCLVEMGTLKDGKVTMIPKVFPGCQTPVKDGDVIVTGDYEKRDPKTPKLAYDAAYKPGDRAKKSQADTLEGLLLNHPLDCPVCDKAGECKLQDYSYQFGRSQSRLVDEKNTPPNKPELSSKITLFTDRCILCTRCVRFTREISGTAELQVVGRGHHEEIDVFPGRPLENKLSGNVVDLCPVGALGSKDFLYTQRVWYLKTADNVCPGCSTGCSIHTDVNKDVVQRIRARENLDNQGYWICDEGRWGYHYVRSPERVVRPLVKDAGAWKPAAWTDLLPKLKYAIDEAVLMSPKRVVVVLSPFLTVEEAFATGSAFKKMSPFVRLVLGPVPVVGTDDSYPKDVKGNPVSPAKFTIRAEKCPNRKGVEAVLAKLQGEVIPFSAVLPEFGSLAAVWFAGGYPNPELVNDALKAPHLPPALLVVQDFFLTKLAEAATYVLPATAAFEKDGTFVNHAGYVQPFPRAAKPPVEARGELQLAFDLGNRKGLATVATVRKDLAKALPEYAALAELKPSAGKRMELATV
ncbi:MAG: molybdopterin-dependent oxidoreductase [Planctomycetia bacterium]|nr:molybdopterin-dependent oxidoreductase [Planctomycetia bacterium]